MKLSVYVATRNWPQDIEKIVRNKHNRQLLNTIKSMETDSAVVSLLKMLHITGTMHVLLKEKYSLVPLFDESAEGMQCGRKKKSWHLKN